MNLFTSYIHLYCFGLAFLILALTIGRLLFNHKGVLHSEHLILGYSLVIAIYAILKTEGVTIAWLILLWLGIYKYWNQKDDIDVSTELDKISNNLLVIWILWSIIFVLKLMHFWNYEYDSPNLHFEDYPYYMKLAEGFNLYGSENGMGHLNLFLGDNNFLQPYRSNDLWLTSFGLEFTNLDTIFIWELFYQPVLLTIIANGFYWMINKNISIVVKLCISLMSLFIFSGLWFRAIINFILPESMEVAVDYGIIAYPKLFLVYAIVFISIVLFFMEKWTKAILWISILPIFVQTTLALVPISIFFMICVITKNILLRQNLNRKIIIFGLNLLIFFSLILIYETNSELENFKLEFVPKHIINYRNVIDLIINFIKNLIYFSSSYYLVLLFLTLLLMRFQRVIKRVALIHAWFLISSILFISVAVYVYFKNVGDTLQLTTNVMIPFLMGLVIYFFYQNIVPSAGRNLYLMIFAGLFVLSFYQVYGESNPFHSTQKIKRYSPSFIHQIQFELSQLNNEYGLYYYNPYEDVPYKEHFPLSEAAFLKLFGRNYDVFNLSGWRLKDEQFTFEQQKYCVFTARQSINLLNEDLDMFSFETDVLSIYRKYYPFSYCLSKVPFDQLPSWLTNEISYSICDERSEVYFYKFKGKKSLL